MECQNERAAGGCSQSQQTRLLTILLRCSAFAEEPTAECNGDAADQEIHNGDLAKSVAVNIRGGRKVNVVNSAILENRARPYIR